MESTIRRVPTPDFVPPSAFLTLSTGYSSSHLAGLFHPTATSGIRSSGVFSAAKPAHLIDESCPHAVSRASSHGELPRRCRFHSLRLQGVDPSSDPLWPTGGLDLPATRSPPGLSLLRVFLRLPWRRLHAPSAHALSRLALAVYATAGLQRVNQQPTLWSIPRPPTRSRFATRASTPPEGAASG